MSPTRDSLIQNRFHSKGTVRFAVMAVVVGWVCGGTAADAVAQVAAGAPKRPVPRPLPLTATLGDTPPTWFARTEPTPHALRGLLGSNPLAPSSAIGEARRENAMRRPAPRTPLMSNYFYRGLTYGSEAVFSPLTVLLNKGLSPLQFSNRSRKLSDYRYAAGASNVLYTITHPRETISEIGLRRWITTEVFPLNFNVSGGKWWPNYWEHLIGGGATYTGLREWYEFHGVRYARVWAALTGLSSAFLNEVVENTGEFRTVPDHLADLMIFDIGAVLLFNIDFLNRFVSHTLNAVDWSPQAAFTPTGEVHNNGQYLAYHVPLPVFDRASIFWRMGFGGQIGFGYRLNEEDGISVGFGKETSKRLVQDARTREFTISLEWAVGLYYDRNNSLLASLIVSELEKDFIVLNVYPGVVPIANGSLGFWTVLDQDLNPTLGITVRQALGSGWGVRW